MYVDGFVAPVPKKNKAAYIKHIEESLPLLKEYGVLRVVENWQDDVTKGESTDFFRAVNAKEDEVIVFSWFEWPSKEVRDEGMRKMMADERMQKMTLAFDGRRLIYGGFTPIFEHNF